MVTIDGGQEECGWRGYLLERLQERWSLWQSDLILIVVHSLWHLPLFFTASAAQSTYPFWIFLIFGGGFTLLINHLHRKTDGSLLATLPFHGLVNSDLDLFPLVGPIVDHANWPLLLADGLCAFLALALHFWKRTSVDSFGHNTTVALPIVLGNKKLQ